MPKSCTRLAATSSWVLRGLEATSTTSAPPAWRVRARLAVSAVAGRQADRRKAPRGVFLPKPASGAARPRPRPAGPKGRVLALGGRPGVLDVVLRLGRDGHGPSSKRYRGRRPPRRRRGSGGRGDYSANGEGLSTRVDAAGRFAVARRPGPASLGVGAARRSLDRPDGDALGPARQPGGEPAPAPVPADAAPGRGRGPDAGAVPAPARLGRLRPRGLPGRLRPHGRGPPRLRLAPPPPPRAAGRPA